MKKEMVIRLVQFPQVRVVRLKRHRFGVGTPAVHAPKKNVGRRLQIDDQIGRWNVV